MMTSAVFLCSLAATMLSATPCQGTGSSDVGQRRRLRAVQEDRNEAMDQRRELQPQQPQSVLSAEEIEALTNMFGGNTDSNNAASDSISPPAQSQSYSGLNRWSSLGSDSSSSGSGAMRRPDSADSSLNPNGPGRDTGDSLDPDGPRGDTGDDDNDRRNDRDNDRDDRRDNRRDEADDSFNNDGPGEDTGDE
mmetsp:Transcript_51418/g.129152  ORF Transcript_51418/g.129152 Transcript_51418/m.129152 type:complete len:192 (-) Transcript_51418:316-891(-)